MADVIYYDTSTGEVLKVLTSVHTPDFENGPGIVIDPEYPKGVIARYLKVENGSIVEKTEAEKSASDLEISPDYAELRKSEYLNMEDMTMEALVEFADLMNANGHDVGEKMEEVLVMRNAIKASHPKP